MLHMLIASMRRRPGDPRVIKSGPSSLGAPDRLARLLGWLSIGIGVAELFAPRRIARPLGLSERTTPLIRMAGLREIDSGMATLAVDPRPGLVYRIGGDALDLASLGAAWRSVPRRYHTPLLVAFGVVATITVLDIVAAGAMQRRHARRGALRDYGDRSGFRASPAQMRGAAREYAVPRREREQRHDGGSRAPTPAMHGGAQGHGMHSPRPHG